MLAEKWGSIAQIFCIAALAFGRFAVMAFLLALLQGSAYVWLRRALWVVGGLQGAVNAVLIVVFCVKCDPVHQLWDTELRTCAVVLDSQLAYLRGGITLPTVG